LIGTFVDGKDVDIFLLSYYRSHVYVLINYYYVIVLEVDTFYRSKREKSIELRKF